MKQNLYEKYKEMKLRTKFNTICNLLISVDPCHKCDLYLFRKKIIKKYVIMGQLDEKDVKVFIVKLMKKNEMITKHMCIEIVKLANVTISVKKSQLIIRIANGLLSIPLKSKYSNCDILII